MEEEVKVVEAEAAEEVAPVEEVAESYAGDAEEAVAEEEAVEEAAE